MIYVNDCSIVQSYNKKFRTSFAYENYFTTNKQQAMASYTNGNMLQCDRICKIKPILMHYLNSVISYTIFIASLAKCMYA